MFILFLINDINLITIIFSSLLQKQFKQGQSPFLLI